MEFDYCLIAAGTSHIRAPSEKLFWREGDVLSLNWAPTTKVISATSPEWEIHGEPDAELEDLLSEVDEYNWLPESRSAPAFRDVRSSLPPKRLSDGRGMQTCWNL